jgi:hypothetical protein
MWLDLCPAEGCRSVSEVRSAMELNIRVSGLDGVSIVVDQTALLAIPVFFAPPLS